MRSRWAYAPSTRRCARNAPASGEHQRTVKMRSRPVPWKRKKKRSPFFYDAFAMTVCPRSGGIFTTSSSLKAHIYDSAISKVRKRCVKTFTASKYVIYRTFTVKYFSFTRVSIYLCVSFRHLACHHDQGMYYKSILNLFEIYYKSNGNNSIQNDSEK